MRLPHQGLPYNDVFIPHSNNPLPFKVVSNVELFRPSLLDTLSVGTDVVLSRGADGDQARRFDSSADPCRSPARHLPPCRRPSHPPTWRCTTRARSRRPPVSHKAGWMERRLETPTGSVRSYDGPTRRPRRR
eukprot:EG_transcript_23258